jgi:hypothetical protein
LGIFSRMLIYPLIEVGAGRHRLDLVLAGVALEALLWTAVPPVEETFGFVEDAIEKELGWLPAPSGPQKALSFVLLALFPAILFADHCPGGPEGCRAGRDDPCRARRRLE